MAFVTGTSTDHLDLLEDLKTALEANGWTTEKEETIDSENYKYFKGPNITIGATTVNVHINIRTWTNSVSGYHNWEIRGATGFDGGVAFTNQPGTYLATSTGAGATLTYANPALTLINSSMSYWIAINDRRIIIMVKAGTTFINGYFGLLLPYGTPTEFPYPLYIAGTAGETNQNDSVGNFLVGSCYDPCNAAGRLRDLNGDWLEINNYSGSTTKTFSSFDDNFAWPYRYTNLFHFSHTGGTPPFVYPLYPIIIGSNANGGNLYGELDGIYYIPGADAAPEDTITISAENYIVTQTMSRNNREDFAVIKQV